MNPVRDLEVISEELRLKDVQYLTKTMVSIHMYMLRLSLRDYAQCMFSCVLVEATLSILHVLLAYLLRLCSVYSLHTCFT